MGQSVSIGIVLLSLLLTYFTPCYSVSIVNFEHVIAGWVDTTFKDWYDWVLEQSSDYAPIPNQCSFKMSISPHYIFHIHSIMKIKYW